MQKVKFVELRQKHVEKFNEELLPELTPQKPSIYAGAVVRAAAKAGWFETSIDPEAVGEMPPAEVNRLLKAVMDEYTRVMAVSPGMILAAADYADNPEGRPPPELDLALSCEGWHCLPTDGGYLDQPAGLLRRMTVASNIYYAVKGFNAADNSSEWANKNPELWKIYAGMIQMRKDRDG